MSELDERDQAYQQEATKVTESLEALVVDSGIQSVTEEERAPKGELSARDQAYQANADEQEISVAVADRATEETKADKQAPATSGTTTGNLGGGGPYDPGANNIGDVVAYVDAHPSELDAVLASEKAGQNRVTLVQQLETRKG